MKIAIQLYSFINSLGDDYYAVLRRIHEVGYQHVELLGRNTKKGYRFSEAYSPADVKHYLAQLNLTPISLHETVPKELPPECFNWDMTMHECDALGIQKIVLPAYLVTSEEEAKRFSGGLNTVGARLQQRGFTLYIHNHTIEFARLDDGTTLFDRILDETDPYTVRVELDLVWALRGGADLPLLLTRLGRRCDMLHQQDVSKAPVHALNAFDAMRLDPNPPASLAELNQRYIAPEDCAELGTGQFDFSGFYAAIANMPWIEYVVVENEMEGVDKFAIAARELAWMKALL